MNSLKKIGLGVAVIFFLLALPACGPGTQITAGVHYNNPVWAPAYYPGVRYYYFPDIETYYDLSDNDFVYLDDGQWIFSSVLPPMYSGFNLYSGFVVSLNSRVYRPWLHHQYYVSHYPRYYYRNVYHNNYASIRGFNENIKKPIIPNKEEHAFNNNNIRVQKPGNNEPRKLEAPKPSQKTNYYGRKIGQPVKVRPQMREERSGKRGHEIP